MTTTLLETYSIALEGTSDLNRRILKENRELQAEVKELLIAKDDKKRKNHELRNKLADARAEIRELKADNKRLYKEHKECRLVEQVSSNSNNSSSTHTHTKETEMDAVDYNETCVTCGKHWH